MDPLAPKLLPLQTTPSDTLYQKSSFGRQDQESLSILFKLLFIIVVRPFIRISLMSVLSSILLFRPCHTSSSIDFQFRLPSIYPANSAV